VDTEVITPQLPGLNVVERRGYGTGKRRRVVSLPGVNLGRMLVVHNNSLRNVVRGIAERVLYRKDNGGVYREPPRALPGAFERLRGFRNSLLRCLPSTTHIALEDYPSLLVGRKRVVAQRAVESLLKRPVEREDAKLNVFVNVKKSIKPGRAIPHRGLFHRVILGIVYP